MRLIDVDRLLKEFPIRINHYDKENGNFRYVLGIEAVMDYVKEMPTVEAEPVRHGHWVRNDNGTYSCSECQSWIPNEQHYYARYCLHCGAKMDEEKENE